MKECEQSRVVPFRMSGVRLRATARDYRRRGQVLEALSLVRRGAIQDDTAAAWQALATELRQLACWEAASVVLARVISRPDAAPSAWLDMARCLSAQGKPGLAEDCLYQLLTASPWSAEADSAREMLRAMAEEGEKEPSRRVALLSRRAMAALHADERTLGMRRLRRAIRLSRHKTDLLITLALMYLMEGQCPQAIRCLTRAIKAEPDNAQAVCALAAVLYHMEKPRMARGVLAKAAGLAVSPEMEECFCSTAAMLQAWPELEGYLKARLKRTPHRIPLLHAYAHMDWEQGRHAQAQECWKKILAIDPLDGGAAALLEWSQSPGEILPPRGMLPPPALTRQRERLTTAEDLFLWGSEAHNALEGCILSTEMRDQQLALAAAASHPDREAEIRWLREIAVRPDVSDMFRQQALMRLAELRYAEPIHALVGGQYGTLQCRPDQRSMAQQTWRRFLPALLRSAARYGRASEIAGFAAKIWPTLTPGEQREAATSMQRCWSHMMLTLWLWKQGRSEEADRELRSADLPMRHFRRLIGRFVATLEKDAGDAGEGES